ncbi:MAG TPA: hypothetical protein VF088_01495 [Pyrinomonadaceae bacterium]
MSSLFEELVEQSRLLTAKEKARLVRLWMEESQRRYQAYLKGEIEVKPGDEVMNRARSILTGVK